jgi:hypothetical protein
LQDFVRIGACWVYGRLKACLGNKLILLFFVVVSDVFAKKIAVLYRGKGAILFKAGVKGC